jgi:hypothetical protein
MTKKKVICPVCEEKGLRSCVYPGEIICSKMHPLEYYDPDGIFHSHDRNITGTEYRCSNGHKWITNTSKACWCGWKQEPLIEIKILEKDNQSNFT